MTRFAGVALTWGLLSVVLGASACGGEEAPAGPVPTPAPAAPAAPSARVRAEAVRAALPAPSTADAFTFEADVLQSDLLFGHARYALAPEGTGDAARWIASEHNEVTGEAGVSIQDTRAVLARDLRFDRYERTETRGVAASRKTDVTWTQGGRLQVTTRSGTDEAASDARDGDRAALATFAGLLLLLRRLPAEPATYELPIFAATTAATALVTLENVGPARLDVAGRSFDTSLARTTVSGVKFEFHRGRLDGRPMAIVMPEREVTIVEHGLVDAVAPSPIDPATPATSSAEVAARFVLGFLLRDAAVVAGAIDAPSVRKGLAAQGYAGDDAGVAARLLDGLSADGVPARKQAELSARAAVVRGSSAPVGSDVEVRLGRPVQGLVLSTRSIGAVWYVVGVGAAR